MDKLKGARYFSKFDVWWGYNNVWIWSGNEWKAMFKTNQGLYEPTVMFFGMCNSPATFQAMMDKIFKKEIEGDLIIVYMDDVLGFSKTINRLKKIEWIILEKAQEHDLFFKAKKCKFWIVVQEGKLAMDSAKLKEILEWPTPKTVREVQSFLGFGNFYTVSNKTVQVLVTFTKIVLRLMNKRKINCLYSCSVLSKLIYNVRQSSNLSV